MASNRLPWLPNSGAGFLFSRDTKDQGISLSGYCSPLPFDVGVASVASEYLRCFWFSYTIVFRPTSAATDDRLALIQSREQQLCWVCAEDPSLAVVLMFPAYKLSVRPKKRCRLFLNARQVLVQLDDRTISLWNN